MEKWPAVAAASAARQIHPKLILCIQITQIDGRRMQQYGCKNYAAKLIDFVLFYKSYTRPKEEQQQQQRKKKGKKRKRAAKNYRPKIRTDQN